MRYNMKQRQPQFTVVSRYASVLLVMSTLFAADVCAQDSRPLKEPLAPSICQLIPAQLTINEVDAQTLTAPDTQRLQQAINQCPSGKALRLVRHSDKNYFLTGALQMKAGVSLVIDAGVVLAGSRLPADYDKGEKSCGTVDQKGRGCRPLIGIAHSQNAGLFGDGVIDGQGGKKILGGAETWWEIARRAQREDLHQNVPRMLEITQSREMALHRIWLKNSANFHVTLNQVDGFTAWGIHIDTPATARNTDGIDPISSRNITITKSYIRTGDDNVAIKAGNQGPTENITISDNHFYSGHGMSIGSETNGNIRHVLVEKLSIDGATSGLRIKSDVSRGGLVQDVTYRDICIQNSKAPLDFDTHYGKRASGDLIPEYRDIHLERVQVLTPGKLIFHGYDTTRPLRMSANDLIVPEQSTIVRENALWSSAVVQSTLNQNFAWQPLQSATKNTACAYAFAAYPSPSPTDKRPQLSEVQAAHFSYGEVLGYAGLPGKEQRDLWDPLSSPVVHAQQITPDYIVNASEPADGKHRFQRLQDAINQIVTDDLAHRLPASRRITVLVEPGIYDGLVYIPETSVPISVIGRDAATTRIRANLDAAITGTQYQERFGAQFAQAPAAITHMFNSIRTRPIIGTFGTAVLWVKSQAFQMRDITIENSYNKNGAPAPQACEGADCPGNGVYGKSLMVHHQALAMMTDGVDKAQFEQVRLLGLQDTLYMRAGKSGQTARHFFYHSYIEGDVDYIFGDATAYFLETEIRSLGPRTSSYVAAPSTNLNSRYGFVFNRCRFTHDQSSNAMAGKFYLVRQWFHNQRCTPYGKVPIDGYRCEAGTTDQFVSPAGTITRQTIETVGKMIVLNSVIGAHIHPSTPWSDWNKNGTLPYRPAQFNSDDFWRNLSASTISPAAFGYQAAPAPMQFLGEFNNQYE